MARPLGRSALQAVLALLLTVLVLPAAFAVEERISERLFLIRDKPGTATQFQMIVRAGCLDEANGQCRGLAHYLEHLVLVGRNPEHKDAGVRLIPDGAMNGWTTQRSTRYWHSAPAREAGPKADLERVQHRPLRGHLDATTGEVPEQARVPDGRGVHDLDPILQLGHRGRTEEHGEPEGRSRGVGCGRSLVDRRLRRGDPGRELIDLRAGGLQLRLGSFERSAGRIDLGEERRQLGLQDVPLAGGRGQVERDRLKLRPRRRELARRIRVRRGT